MIVAFELPLPVLALGAVSGMTYGLLAVGLVLVYRSNRIVNFAHGEIGAFGAAVLGLVAGRFGVPYWCAFALALLCGAGAGAATEAVVVRRLRGAPAPMSVVATLGAGQFLLLASLAINDDDRSSTAFPAPSGFPTIDLGSFRMTPAHTAMLFLTPVVVGALTLFLQRSRTGLAIRAAASNPDAARLAGVGAARMSTASWAIAGAIAAFTSAFVFPARGFVAESLGPALLLRALVPAVLARMLSLPVALAGGVLVGVVEQAVLWNFPRSGLVEVVLLVAVAAGFLLRPEAGGRRAGIEAWSGLRAWSPELTPARRRAARRLGLAVATVGVGVAVAAGAVATNATATVLTLIATSAIVGLSVGVLTGLSGQLSFGQFAIAGIGATVSYRIAIETGNYVLSFATAGMAGAAVSTVLGLPLLRARGLMLAVSTLAFALAANAWLLQQPWALGDGVRPPYPVLGSIALDTARAYYFFALAMLVLAVATAGWLWQSSTARRVIAVRDNADAARAFGVSPTIAKLQAFAVAGALAGIGGATYAHGQAHLTDLSFPVARNVDVVAMAVLGGIGTVAGPIVGSIYIVGVPRFLPLDAAGLAATSLGWLLLLLYVPRGLIGLVAPIRRRVLDHLAGPSVVAPDDARPARPDLTRRLPAPPSIRRPSAELALRTEGLSKAYGGVVAVDDVLLEVRAGEILGLIGPNGAGKTTLFELLSGFGRPDRGRVWLDGIEVTRWSPERRCRAGLVRSFQDASLFASLTVGETIELATGRRHGHVDRKARVTEIIELFGLGGHRDVTAASLSTGTRRLAELAAAAALDPRVLLLDEPTSGLAQREVEALGPLVRQLRDHLDATIVVIEHDVPMLLGLCDRLVAMDTGRVLTDGDPAAVVRHPDVLAAYLGSDAAAVHRSGTGVLTTTN